MGIGPSRLHTFRSEKGPWRKDEGKTYLGWGTLFRQNAVHAFILALLMQTLTWAEVNFTHRVRNGVYQRNGRVISLLTDFGRINPCYPDRQTLSGNRIYYTGAGRRGDQPLSPANRALFAAIKSKHSVPLFNKLGAGRWEHMGLWRVIDGRHVFDEGEKRMLWQFTLERADLDD